MSRYLEVHVATVGGWLTRYRPREVRNSIYRYRKIHIDYRSKFLYRFISPISIIYGNTRIIPAVHGSRRPWAPISVYARHFCDGVPESNDVQWNIINTRYCEYVFVANNVAINYRYKSIWKFRSIIDMDFSISIYRVSNINRHERPVLSQNRSFNALWFVAIRATSIMTHLTKK